MHALVSLWISEPNTGHKYCHGLRAFKLIYISSAQVGAKEFVLAPISIWLKAQKIGPGEVHVLPCRKADTVAVINGVLLFRAECVHCPWLLA